MTADQEEATRKILASLWQRNLPVLRERLDQLDRAAESVASHSLSDTAREEAGATAHKLAGSLGMFGYSRGTELARSLELLLDSDDKLEAIAVRELTVALRESLAL